MGIAVYLNIYAFFALNEIVMFFSGGANCVNSVMTIIWAFMMIMFLVYAHIKVHRLYDDMGKKKFQEELEPYVEGSSKKTFHSTMINIYFMDRRLLMIVTFIHLHEYSSIQVTILMELSLINFIYTAVAKPYEENNIGEIMNEMAILLCVYIMHVFFLSNNAEFSAIIGWVFIGVCAQNIVINLG